MIPLPIRDVNLPAWLLLGLWLVSQFFISSESWVAWMAHVGGFVAGLLLVHPFVGFGGGPRRPGIETRRPAGHGAGMPVWTMRRL